MSGSDYNSTEHNKIFWEIVYSFAKIDNNTIKANYDFKGEYNEAETEYTDQGTCHICYGDTYLLGNKIVGCTCYYSEDDNICKHCEGDIRVDYNDTNNSYFLWKNGCTCFNPL